MKWWSWILVHILNTHSPFPFQNSTVNIHQDAWKVEESDVVKDANFEMRALVKVLQNVEIWTVSLDYDLPNKWLCSKYFVSQLLPVFFNLTAADTGMYLHTIETISFIHKGS